MPRYLFHIHVDKDFEEFPDNEGTALPDAAAARAQAVAIAGSLLREKGETFWGGTEWRMDVIDEAGQTVCELRFSAHCTD
jgi:hypothetical protein